MNQTPVHELCNLDLLRLIPFTAKKILEVGCSSGALAREFKKLAPSTDYIGIEIDPDYANLAKRFCNNVVVTDIEKVDVN